jgi:hypothetical protein
MEKRGDICRIFLEYGHLEDEKRGGRILVWVLEKYIMKTKLVYYCGQWQAFISVVLNLQILKSDK